MRIKYLTKIVVVSLIVAITICSCKKSNPSSYNISFDINGSKQTFKTKTSCGIYSDPPHHIYWFNLYAFNEDSSNYITIGVFSQSPINTTNTYIDTMQVVNQDVTIQVYEKDPVTNVAGLQTSNDAGFPNDVKVKFSNITSGSVSGSFSGNVAVYGRGTVTKITNGTFYLPVK
jgi:hypothetical protein